MASWFFAGGIFLLLGGSEAFLRGAARLGKSLGFSPLLTGLIFVSLAACGPQLAVTVAALKAHSPGLVVPAIVGANIVNLLLVLGIGALAHPLYTSPKILVRDGGMLFVASVAFAFVCADGMVSKTEGMMLAGVALLFTILTFATDWRHSCETSSAMQRADFFSGKSHPSFVGSLLLFVFGTVLLGLGAAFLLSGGMVVARDYRLAPDVMALTLMACGMAIPSVVITFAAIASGRMQMVIGHLFGTCIFGLLLIVGGAAIVTPLPVAAPLRVDIIVMLSVSALLLPLLAMRWRIGRLQGSALLACYIAYLGFLSWSSGLLTANMIGL